MNISEDLCPSVRFDSLSDGDFFIVGTGLLWQKMNAVSARLLSTTGDVEFDTTPQEMPSCWVSFVSFDYVQQVADALGISMFRLFAAIAAFSRRSKMITAKCPPLDTPLITVPRFPKRLLETLAGKVEGRKGAWDGVEPSQITLRWLLMLPYDSIYNDTAPAYMPNNAANGRVMVAKFLEEWGIDTALMGPSYPFDIHTPVGQTAPTLEVSDNGLVQYGNAMYRQEVSLNWQIPLVELLDDGDTNWNAVLSPLAAHGHLQPNELLLINVATMSWEDMCQAAGNDVALNIYNACITAAGRDEIPWPPLTLTDEQPGEQTEQPDEQPGEQTEQPDEQPGEQTEESGGNKLPQPTGTRYWHHPESSSLFTTENGEYPGTDGLLEEVDETTFLALQAQYDLKPADDVKLPHEQFLSTKLRESTVLPDVVTYPDGSTISTEDWTGASIEGWSDEEIAALFSDPDQCAMFMTWLDYFNWRVPAEEPDSTGGTFAVELEAFVRDLGADLQKTVLDMADTFAGFEPEQRQELLRIFSILS